MLKIGKTVFQRLSLFNVQVSCQREFCIETQNFKVFQLYYNFQLILIVKRAKMATMVDGLTPKQHY